MKDEEVAIGIGVLLLLAMESNKSMTIDWGDPSQWAWPVPDFVNNGVVYPATVSNEFNAVKHRGVDILYGPGVPAQAKPGWFAPPDTPILAARDGKIYSIDKSPRGWEVVIDHGKPWATYYQHLSSIRKGMDKGRVVVAGEQIGVMGFDPTDPKKTRHLHWEAWWNGAENGAVDPQATAAQMPKWKRTTWNGGAL